MNRNESRVSHGGRRISSFIATLLALVLVVESCKPDQGPAPVERLEPISPVRTVVGSPAAPAATVAAPAQTAVTQAPSTPDALEELLAPIALYPDQLLGQILAASVNSQEVLDAGNWLLQNENLKGNDLDAAAQKAGFGPAMRALVQYPTVVDMMCQQMDWTKQLGSAFSSDQKSVLDAVQRLRKEAADVGNLKSSPQQTVSTRAESGNVYIEVKPADPTIVYVPQYDAQAVYTTPPPPGTTTTTTTTTTTAGTNTTTAATTESKEEEDGVSTGAAVAIGLIAFGVGVAVGNAANDDYYYPHWGVGVYYGPRPFYPPAYVYRPVYGPAFRPAYGYSRPANYRYNYNNVRVNNNIVVNNNDYYNRFNNNQNLRTGSARSPIANSPSRAGQPRAAQTPAAGSNWKGQSTYQGARPGATTPATRPAAGTREAQTANRATARTSEAATRADRGHGNTTSQAATRQSNAGTPSRPSTPAAPRATPAGESAFSGAQANNNGSFQRSASARGNASVGSRPVSGGRARTR